MNGLLRICGSLGMLYIDWSYHPIHQLRLWNREERPDLVSFEEQNWRISNYIEKYCAYSWVSDAGVIADKTIRHWAPAFCAQKIANYFSISTPRTGAQVLDLSLMFLTVLAVSKSLQDLRCNDSISSGLEKSLGSDQNKVKIHQELLVSVANLMICLAGIKLMKGRGWGALVVPASSCLEGLSVCILTKSPLNIEEKKAYRLAQIIQHVALFALPIYLGSWREDYLCNLSIMALSNFNLELGHITALRANQGTF